MKYGYLIPAVMVGATLAGGQAMAQVQVGLAPFAPYQAYDRGRNINVLNRDRPEYDAIGLRNGPILTFPKIDLSLGSNDNVLATRRNKISDQFWSAVLSSTSTTDWARHSLQANFLLDTKQYFKRTSENRTNVQFNVIGRYDLVGDSFLQGGAEIRTNHIERSDIAFPTGGAEPVPLRATSAFGRAVYVAGRYRLVGSVSGADIHYSNIDRVGGGRIDLRSRDYTAVTETGRVEYAISPAAALFVDARNTSLDYKGVANALNRNATDRAILAGANFDISALARGEVGFGYETRDYSSSALRSISGFSMNGKIEYFPTELTTVTATLGRNIDDSILANTGGYIATRGSIRVDHELLRNLLLNASYNLERDKFSGVSRRDSIQNISVGAQYLVTQSIGLSASVIRRDRTSHGVITGPEYATTEFALTVTLQR